MQHTCCCSLYSIPRCFNQSNLNVSSSGAPITIPGILFCKLTYLTICSFPCEIHEQFPLSPSQYFNFTELIFLLHTVFSFPCLLSLTPAPLLFLCINRAWHLGFLKCLIKGSFGHLLKTRSWLYIHC